jgi:hypothetical protein
MTTTPDVNHDPRTHEPRRANADPRTQNNEPRTTNQERRTKNDECLLTLAPRTGTVLGVRAQITIIRPALVVECLLRECDPELSVEALARFFEPGWREHPCGPNGGSILAALAHTARAMAEEQESSQLRTGA